MDTDLFVQNVKKYCARKNVKPTVACRESGAGKSIIDQMERRGSIPSVEKVQMLAQYLGVTTSELLGETSNPNAHSDLSAGAPETLTLHDSAIRLKVSEVEMILAYRNASEDEQTAIGLILKKYKKETTTSAG